MAPSLHKKTSYAGKKVAHVDNGTKKIVSRGREITNLYSVLIEAHEIEDIQIDVLIPSAIRKVALHAAPPHLDINMPGGKSLH